MQREAKSDKYDLSNLGIKVAIVPSTVPPFGFQQWLTLICSNALKTYG